MVRTYFFQPCSGYDIGSKNTLRPSGFGYHRLSHTKSMAFEVYRTSTDEDDSNLGQHFGKVLYYVWARLKIDQNDPRVGIAVQRHSLQPGFLTELQQLQGSG